MESRPFMAPTRAWRSRCRSCPASDGFDITKLLLNHEVEVEVEVAASCLKRTDQNPSIFAIRSNSATTTFATVFVLRCVRPQR
jgi:hypothetical protein